MTGTKVFVRRVFERLLESRRQALRRRVDAYLEGVGLTPPRDLK